MNTSKETFISGGYGLFPKKVLISGVTKSEGTLTKIMRLDPTTGELVKDGSECAMRFGSIEKITVSSPEGFSRLLRSRKSNQALVHGLCEYDKALVTTKGKIKSHPNTEGNPVIARTKEYIKYYDAPGALMFDHDKPRPLSVGSDEALLSYSPTELLEKLSVIHPAIASAPYVSTPSTSSCIYSSTGEQLRGEGSGSHIYLFVKKTSDIPRYLETIGKRLFLAGLGRIELSRSGAALQRTLVDLSVGSPERIDFVAGAVCQDGLEQRLPDPVIKNGELLDTESLANLAPEEEAAYQSILQDLIRQAKPNQEKVITEYLETEAGKLVAAKSIPLEEARKIVTSRQDHVLEDDDILYFSHLKDGVTVAHVLENGPAFHGKALADPLEPEYENYSKTKAKFFWNDGNPVVNSFAHGQTKYTFRRFEKEASERNKKKNDSQQVSAMFERFVFLASENKIIDTVGHDIKDSMMIERAFVLSHAGQFFTFEDTDGIEKTVPLPQYWLNSNEKKVAYSLRYQPGEDLFFINGDGRSYYNTFRFPYQSAEPIVNRESRLNKWHKIMDTVFHAHRGYMEDWFSYSVKYPEKRTGIMPVCISDPGLGKTLVMAIKSRVIGHQNFSNAKILDVTGLGKSGTQWGDWIFNKKISCIEEIDPEGDNGISYKILDALKDIITNETLSLNLKGGRNGTFPVYSNIIGFSNHKNCVKIPYGDRRLFVVDSTGQQKLKPSEYGEIWDWMKDEQNIIAVFQYLLDREISDQFTPGQAKMTDAKKSLQADGRSAMQTAFDLLTEKFPCDLLTVGELQRAVVQAMHHIDGGTGIAPEVNLNADKQFQAIMKSCTGLVAAGKRISVQRRSGAETKATIRAIRNSQKWTEASKTEIQEEMKIDIPPYWMTTEDEDFELF